MSNDRLLMSDAIKGIIPDLDEKHLKPFEDSFIVGTLELVLNDGNIELLSGALSGFSLDKSVLKIDIKVKTYEAFTFFKDVNSTICKSIYMHLGDEEIHLSGPYRISSPKMMDFDYKAKTCILGIDLFKE